MPISETLLLPGFKTISDICRPSSSAVRHARTAASLTAAAMVLAENAPACSSRPSASSTKSDLLGLALRTSLACELEARTGFSLRWNRSVTPAGRSLWVLGTPALRTDEIVFGSLLPTPRASTADHGADRTSHSPNLLVALLPTPRMTDGDRGGRGDLIQAIRGNENPHFRNPLLPTPIARDWRSGKVSETTHSRNARPLSEQLGRRGVHGVSLLLAISEWLLGFPPGWLANVSPPTAMPSPRKSPRRSAAP